MKKVGKKIIALTVMAVLLGSGVIQTKVQAAAASSEKEEVVYVNLDGDGNPTGTYVVNIFKDKDITDYGNYSLVKNMNTDDAISNEAGVITIQNSADQLYYEGILDHAELPWNIETTYQMDGQYYTAEEIAGKSGKFAFELSVTENMNAKKSFFENYALQVTVKLDTNLCRNIASEGATLANAGKYKQLIYTIMPGSEKNISITADVTDFEMESITMNGIRLELGIDSSSIDTGKLQAEIGDLQKAVTDLDQGANDLKDGAESLNDGADRLEAGIDQIEAALKELDSKSSGLTSGSAKVKGALETIQASLDKVSVSAGDLQKLSQASQQIKDGIDRLTGGLLKMGSSIDSYYSALSEAGLKDTKSFIDQHNAVIAALGITDTQRALYQAYLTGGQTAFQTKLGELVRKGDAEAVSLYQKASAGDTQACADYITAAGKLITVESLLKADISYIQGSELLIRGLRGTLDSKNGELMTGALQLQDRFAEFHTGIENMVSVLGGLAVDMTTLKNGIDTLVSNYAVLDGGISNYTEAVNSISEGYGQISDGALTLVTGISDLYGGTKTLSGGTDQFVSETAGLQDKMDTELAGMIKEFSGSDFEPISFVSDSNTKVDSVQFVIQIAPVHKPEEAKNIAAEKEHLTFWQKFLRLFGLF